MSGSGFKDWSTGDLVTADEFDGYVMKQVIAHFADATARDAAITSPEEGMHAYLADTNRIVEYDGSAWHEVAGAIATTKGDLIVHTGSGLTRVGVGADGTLLMADSAESTGLRWGAGATDRALIAGFVDATHNNTAQRCYRVVAGLGSVSSAQIPVVMDRAGSVVGVTIYTASVRTAGTFTATVYIQGVSTGFSAQINATDTSQAYAVQASGLDTFTAGQYIDVRCTGSSYAPESYYFEASVTVQYS